MKIDKEKLRIMIRKMMFESGLNESDIIANDKSKWDESKSSFKATVNAMLNNIDDDKYEDADGEIDSVMRTLKLWKKRIAKNLSDSTQQKDL